MALKKVTRFGIQRKIVAAMTTESWQNIPHVSYLYEPDVTKFMTAFRAFNEELAKEGKHITINTAILKAIAEAVKEAPQMNAHLHFEPKLVRGKEKIYDNIDISVPWILPGGRMMTITMKDVGSKSLGEITAYTEQIDHKFKKTDLDEVMYSVSIHDTMENLSDFKLLSTVQRLYGSLTNKKHRVKHLTGEAKKEYESISESDRLTYEDLKQGTITVSNVGSITRGSFGSINMLMIIPPQVCAIGVAAVQRKPVVKKNAAGVEEIVPADLLPICLCFDHRSMDFGDLRPFLQKMDSIFNNPEDFLKY